VECETRGSERVSGLEILWEDSGQDSTKHVAGCAVRACTNTLFGQRTKGVRKSTNSKGMKSR